MRDSIALIGLEEMTELVVKPLNVFLAVTRTSRPICIELAFRNQYSC